MLNLLRIFQPWPWPSLSAARRGAILEATIRVVGSRGYHQATVEEIATEAGISEAAFHRYFDDKHDCFLAAYDMLIERLFAEVQTGCREDLEWRQRMEAGLATLLDRFAVDGALARTAVVEVAAVGAEARRRHWEALTRFGRFLDGGRPLADGPVLPKSTALMSAGAVSGVIFEELRAGRAESLPALLPDLLFAMLVPFVGPRAAAGEMRRAAEAAA